MATGKQGETLMVADPPPPYYTPNPPAVVSQQAYQPAYVGQQHTVVVATPQVPMQNVVLVQTVPINQQKPGIAPGFAFCKFTPGVIETVIRVSLVVSHVVDTVYKHIVWLRPFHRKREAVADC